jgi:hypothetical protein
VLGWYLDTNYCAAHRINSLCIMNQNFFEKKCKSESNRVNTMKLMILEKSGFAHVPPAYAQRVCHEYTYDGETRTCERK